MNPRSNARARTRRGPRLRLWSLTRHEGVTLHALQAMCPSFKLLSHNRLAQIAAGKTDPGALTPTQRRELFAALVRTGLARKGAEAAWLEPIDPALERSLLRRRPHGAVRRNNAGDPGPESFRRFSMAMVGAGCWDHWKKETRVALTQDVLDRFRLERDPFMKPRSAEDRWSCAAFDRAEKALRAGLLRGESVMVKGASGSGKTAMARHVLHDLTGGTKPKAVVSRYLPPDTRNIREHSLCAGIAMDLSDRFSLQQKQPNSTQVAMRRIRDGAKRCAEGGLMLVVVIEECHHMRELIGSFLKRTKEALMDGYEERMATLLLGQTDASAAIHGGVPLDVMLANGNNREWVERLTIIDMPPLGGSVGGYVAFRFTRAGGDASKVLGEGWEGAIRRALPGDRLVPQAVDKLLSDAMRMAHAMNDRKVTAAHLSDAATTGISSAARARAPEEVAA